MQRKVLTNHNPQSNHNQLAHPTPPIPPNPVFNLRCQELEEEYKMVITLPRIKFQSAKGIS